MVRKKGGAPLGNRNASREYRTRGFKEGEYTTALFKACKRIDMARKEDPSYGLGDKKQRERERKKLKVIDRIAEDHVLAAEAGNREDRRDFVERMEGKAVNRTETETLVKGNVDHKHSGFKISFEPPKSLDVSRETKVRETKVIEGEKLN